MVIKDHKLHLSTHAVVSMTATTATRTELRSAFPKQAGIVAAVLISPIGCHIMSEVAPQNIWVDTVIVYIALDSWISILRASNFTINAVAAKALSNFQK